ncbi:hypothetical protein [Clostridium sp.]|uniref:hypothetical protein n=1 Tax=Clostridium sp. TaxID=1506 RepID=UPI002FC649EF
MKYYIVALLDEDSSTDIAGIQKNISKKYKLYKNISSLYIPLGSVSNMDFDKLDELVTKIISPYKKFKIGIDNTLSLSEDLNTINLRIEDKGYINRISRNLLDTLSLHGITVKDFNSNTFNIPLSTANHSVRKASSNNSLIIDSSKDKEDFFKFVKINRLEIWKSLSNKKDSLVKSYILKDY